MKFLTKRLLITASVISTVSGVFFTIPALAKEQFLAASFAFLFVIVGIVLFAIGFGEEYGRY